MNAEQRWRRRVLDHDEGECAAQRHAFACRGIAHHAHHIEYRSQIPTSAYWTVFENGIGLSLHCHDLAHTTHNANLPEHRRQDAAAAIKRHRTFADTQ